MLADILHKVAQMGQSDYAFSFRPSSAGPERCIRQMVYKGLGFVEVPRPGRMTMVMDDSSWHEYLTIDWINKTAYKLHSSQMEIDCGPWEGGPLKGHIDGILTDLAGQDYLFEHKALNHFSYQRIENGSLPWDYLTQCCFYVKGLQKVNPEIDRFVLLIKNKNTAAYLEIIGWYHALVDILTIMEIRNHDGENMTPSNESGDGPVEFENIVTSALAKFSRVKECIDKRSLPPRPHPYGTDFPCGYCGYEEKCWDGYEREATDRKDIVEIEDREFAISLSGYYSIKNSEKYGETLKEEIKGRIASEGVQGIIAGDYIAMLNTQTRKGKLIEILKVQPRKEKK